MILYDATIDLAPPPVQNISQGKLIRCVYDHNGIDSALYGQHQADGVYLIVQSSPLGPEAQRRRAADVRHHHVATLASDPERYAALFGTRKFRVEYEKKNKEAFLKMRFPDWNVFTVGNVTVMELEL